MDDNSKTIQDIYAAFERGDVPFILGKLSDDARFENSDSPELPHHGVYTGKDGITKFFANIGGAFDVKSFEPKTYLSSGDEVMTTGSWTCVVRSTGKSFSANWAMRFLFQGSKITFAHVYEDTAVVAAALRN